MRKWDGGEVVECANLEQFTHAAGVDLLQQLLIVHRLVDVHHRGALVHFGGQGALLGDGPGGHALGLHGRIAGAEALEYREGLQGRNGRGVRAR